MVAPLCRPFPRRRPDPAGYGDVVSQFDVAGAVASETVAGRILPLVPAVRCHLIVRYVLSCDRKLTLGGGRSMATNSVCQRDDTLLSSAFAVEIIMLESLQQSVARMAPAASPLVRLMFGPAWMNALPLPQLVAVSDARGIFGAGSYTSLSLSPWWLAGRPPEVEADILATFQRRAGRQVADADLAPL